MHTSASTRFVRAAAMWGLSWGCAAAGELGRFLQEPCRPTIQARCCRPHSGVYGFDRWSGSCSAVLQRHCRLSSRERSVSSRGAACTAPGSQCGRRGASVLGHWIVCAKLEGPERLAVAALGRPPLPAIQRRHSPRHPRPAAATLDAARAPSWVSRARGSLPGRAAVEDRCDPSTGSHRRCQHRLGRTDPGLAGDAALRLLVQVSSSAVHGQGCILPSEPAVRSAVRCKPLSALHAPAPWASHGGHTRAVARGSSVGADVVAVAAAAA